MAYIKKEWKIKDFQKGDKDLVASLNHMEQGIAEGGGGGGEPAQYLKDAVKSADGNTLTITKKDGSAVVFSPQSGGGEPAAYIKDASVASEKLTLTKKDGSLVELDISGKASIEDVAKKLETYEVTVNGAAGQYKGEANVPVYFEIEPSTDKAVVKAYNVKLNTTKVQTAQVSQLEIPSANNTIAGLMSAADKAKLDSIGELIPSQASPSNQLADKDFVNSTVQTSTAVFRGNFATKADLDAYAGEKKNNDYAVVQADETHSGESWRYKYNGTAWSAEYKLNNTAFTEAQLKAINSGITVEKVAAYDEYATTKQDVISDLATIRSGAALGATAIQPNDNVSKLVNDAGYLTEHQDISGKADKPSELPPELKVPGVDYPWFMINLNPTGIDADGNLHLDHSGYNFNSKQYYTWTGKIVPMAATETTGGLLTAADKIKLNKAITEHQDISGKANVGDSYLKAESDAKYLTEHQDISGKADKTEVTAEAIAREQADTALQANIDTKVDKPTEPVAGQGVNVPYYFEVNYSADKATVKDYTIDLLDKSKAPQQFSIDINKATQTTAGLMSAADKKNVDEMLPEYPTDIESEYVLALKYEDGAWKKYWKETINRSDVVDSGMVDYMVLKS